MPEPLLRKVEEANMDPVNLAALSLVLTFSSSLSSVANAP